MSRRITLLLGSLILVFMLAACSPTTETAATGATSNSEVSAESAPESDRTASEETDAEAESAASGTRVVTDMFGEVTIPTEPKRLVVTSSRYAEYLIAMGLTPDVVLYTSSIEPDYRTEYLQENGVEIVEYPQYEQNFELLLSLAPDLIVAPGISIDEGIYEQMTKIAPTVALDSSIEMEESMSKLADLFGKQSESEAAMADYHTHIEAAAQKLDAALEDQTVLVLRVEPKQYRYLGDDETKGGAIKLLYHGLGLNVPEAIVGAEAWFTPFSLEFLPEIDPDYILMEKRVIDGEDGTEFYDQLMASSLWKGLRAVQENHVIPVSTQELVQGEGPVGYAEFADRLVNELTSLR